MISAIVDGKRVTFDSLTYTAADPGGFETCNIHAPLGFVARPGAEVFVMDGMQIVWHGRVEEPGQDWTRRRAPASISCVGYGAKMKDNQFSMIFIDRDLSQWQDPGRQRTIDLVSSNYAKHSVSATTDENGGPSLELRIEGAWGATTRPDAEAWYDAGEGNNITRVAGRYQTSVLDTNDANWQYYIWMSSDDAAFASSEASSNLRSSGVTTAAASLGTAKRNMRYAMMQLLYGAGPAGTDGSKYTLYWKALRVFGDHGLPVHQADPSVGVDTEVLHPTDVVLYALRRSGLVCEVIEAGRTMAPWIWQLAYRDAVEPEQMIDDMRKLCAYHYGVWEPHSLGGLPRFYWTPPPRTAAASVHRADCESVNFGEQYSNLHNVCRATWHDAGGKRGVVTVEREHPRIPSGQERTLNIDAGLVGSEDSARTIALYSLALDQDSARVTGQVVLPRQVRTYGGTKPAHMLKPGREKIALRDMPVSDSMLLADPPARVDTFSIRRISVDVSSNGVPKTTVELDNGANLIEVMQAQLAQAQASVGVSG